MTVQDIQKSPEETQPVTLNLPGQPVDLFSHGDTRPILSSQVSGPIPVWLMDLIRIQDGVETNPPTENALDNSLPIAGLSDRENDNTNQFETDPEPDIFVKAMVSDPPHSPQSIWEDEDALELGASIPDKVKINPIDELKLLLDKDPHESAALIRSRISDRGFREEALKSLRSHLTLDPNSDALWQIFEELQQNDLKQEA